jgi:biopolymer transport protein ExbB
LHQRSRLNQAAFARDWHPRPITNYCNRPRVYVQHSGFSHARRASHGSALWFFSCNVHDVLQAAQKDLDEAAILASDAKATPIGRFLMSPLRLKHPTPETFHLALEASADKEFVKMRKGDKLFETVVAVAPLLGLLGTVTGLIHTFSNLQIGNGGANAGSANKAAAGIGEALIATATGMIVAIVALVFFRIFVSLQAQQMDYFTEVGNELELIYRQIWCELKSFKGGPSTAQPQPSTALRVDQPSLLDIP